MGANPVDNQLCYTLVKGVAQPNRTKLLNGSGFLDLRNQANMSFIKLLDRARIEEGLVDGFQD